MVPAVGVEPTRYCYQRILSPSCLPIPACRHEGERVLRELSHQGLGVVADFPDEFFLIGTFAGGIGFVDQDQIACCNADGECGREEIVVNSKAADRQIVRVVGDDAGQLTGFPESCCYFFVGRREIGGVVDGDAYGSYVLSVDLNWMDAAVRRRKFQ